MFRVECAELIVKNSSFRNISQYIGGLPSSIFEITATFKPNGHNNTPIIFSNILFERFNSNNDQNVSNLIYVQLETDSIESNMVEQHAYHRNIIFDNCTFRDNINIYAMIEIDFVTYYNDSTLNVSIIDSLFENNIATSKFENNQRKYQMINGIIVKDSNMYMSNITITNSNFIDTHNKYIQNNTLHWYRDEIDDLIVATMGNASLVI